MKLEKLKSKITRMNELIVTFPIWITVGVFGAFRSSESEGWQKSEENTDYGKMY